MAMNEGPITLQYEVEKKIEWKKQYQIETFSCIPISICLHSFYFETNFLFGKCTGRLKTQTDMGSL